jgi:glycosyltransferase involved in cell wall biosynthesis
LKICFVITNLPTKVGGLEKVCLRVAQYLQKAGHEVVILGRFAESAYSLSGFFHNSEGARLFEFQGVNLRILALDAKARLLLKPVFKLIWRKWTFPAAKWLYVAALKNQIVKSSVGADVVHFFGNGPEMLGFAAEAAAGAVGAKFVVEPALHEDQWGDKWFDALLYKRADLLLAHTQHEAGVLERMGIPSTKIRTIVHGVDFCDSGDGERFRKKHGIFGPMVLFLGRKTKQKGAERLLKAWPRVMEEFPEATLVIAGPKSEDFDKLNNSLTTNHTNRREKGNWDLTTEDTESTEGEAGLRPGARAGAPESDSLASKRADFPVSESLTRFASSHASSLATSYPLPATAPGARVLNLDNLTEEEKQDALEACDLLCVPSEGESFGMVYFEAWAYGKPVVGLDLPVLRETIAANEAGIIVSMEPDELTDAVCELLGDSQLRQEMGKNGRKVVRHHYWEAAASSYLNAYSAFGQVQR